MMIILKLAGVGILCIYPGTPCWERVMMVAIMMMCDVADVGISFCLFNDSYFMFITQIRPYISEIF